ncbi:ABC transporter permease [Haloarchaeobius litoreus]|uniref:ABC transporter permease n=1 Tax=Haloarchaeobius litoreus TaxID=755306 RepID=A0ABD6DHC8_9EURY|nr:ABC transporter permease [Haloarchaeobius litoreus]
MSRLRDVLERLVGASGAERAVISIAALVLSILVGAVIVFVSGLGAACDAGANYHLAIPLPGSFEILLFDGRLSLFGYKSCYDPINVYAKLFVGAIGGLPWESGWQPTNLSMEVLLRRMTLLLFAGLSVAVSFRAGLFNIGTQGQMVWGALVSAVTVLFVADFAPAGLAGTVILLPLALFSGAVAGGIWGAIPGALKAYADANEVITTIMLNFVASFGATLMIKLFFQDPEYSNIGTRRIPVNSLVPSLPMGFQGTRSSILALIFALLFAFIVYFVLWGTSFGFDVRTSGLQPEAATYAGVNAERTIVRSMTISGALGGIAGALWVLLSTGRMLSGGDVAGGSLGFDGITVSVLAGNNPIGVIFGSALFGVLKSGRNAVNFQTDVPPELVEVLPGLIILFVAMPEFFRMIGKRIGLDSGQGSNVRTDGGEDDE